MKDEYLICPNCGAENNLERTECLKCFTSLVEVRNAYKQKLQQKLAQKDNSIAIMIRLIAKVTIVLSIITCLFLLLEDDYLQALILLFSSLISVVFEFGFAEVITLLHRINQKINKVN